MAELLARSLEPNRDQTQRHGAVDLGEFADVLAPDLRQCHDRERSSRLAAVALIEKTWRWGPAARRAAGVAALAVIWLPGLAPGLHAAPSMMS